MRSQKLPKKRTKSVCRPPKEFSGSKTPHVYRPLSEYAIFFEDIRVKECKRSVGRREEEGDALQYF